MSLTPLDESEERREGGRPTDDRTDERTGFLQRVREAIGRVVTALSGATDSRETTLESDARRSSGTSNDRDSGDRSAAALDARTAERSLTWADDRTDDRPEPDDRTDRPELVASWDDRGLTLSEPDAGEASISSDTWTDVER
jgi:hypothetical protein